ncbi:MAG: histone deacetylase family protein [Gaiellaceae bacterium]|nr:histone deacetylase family protein [Gaiellaceae bacterium]
MELVSHREMARLHPTGDYPERQERLRVLQEQFEFREAEPASEEDILRCHSSELLELVRGIARPTFVDPDTVASDTTYEAAMLAAGAAIEAVRSDGFALVRPPGHHATPDRAMGFCFFDNVAIAAGYAEAELGVGRIAIVDWDVHHGNGTEDIFRADPTVLFVSMHQWPFYPGTGGPEDQDETLVNVPLPAGSTDEDYFRAWDERVEPAVRAFEPDLVLVSAGFDAHEEDPIAQMFVTEAGFRELARRSAGLAPRTAAVLEGGYNVATLPALVRAALDGFGA